MATGSARVAEPKRNQESIVKVFTVSGAIALFSPAFCLCATLACAQSVTSTQVTASTEEAKSATPLQLDVPAQPLRDTPAAGSDNAIVDANDSRADNGNPGPQVHGSFTTGIGYSKGYGTSTMNAADLDIRGQTDSGRTYDVQIHVMQGKGPGVGPYRGDYGPRYRGY